MQIKEPYAWPLSDSLISVLQEIIRGRASVCIINFGDPKYSVGRGRFHPVEIMVNENGMIQYITDFAYVGLPSSEDLVKEMTSTLPVVRFNMPAANWEGLELFQLWQMNFAAYYNEGIYQVMIEEIQ